jgi:alkanesulfonate monooxygenase SsuD/methylene tetrahydromethanopterin reductase-like flavin-dependent oxidoreductase (luciferase family)
LKLGYFTMPLHPPGRNFTETLQEDREAIILADRLGFSEAYVGEHLTDRFETVTSCLLFLATLISDTRQIRLGSGTANLAYQHPAALAAHVAMLDHLAKGRFIFGISPGALPSDAEILGLLDQDRGAMFVEAIDHILAIWSQQAPYAREGRFWNVTTERTFDDALGIGTVARPFQSPHPPIVVTVVAPHSAGIVEAAKRGWFPLSGGFLLSKWVATHWPKYEEGRRAIGAVADYRDWRVARSVFVADDEATARRYALEGNSPYRFYFDQMLRKMKKGGRTNLFKADPNASDDTIDLDVLMDDLVIYGTPSRVADKILALRERVGPFGSLVYAGHDWVDQDLSRRSMELMAEDVMPRINSALRESF